MTIKHCSHALFAWNSCGTFISWASFRAFICGISVDDDSFAPQWIQQAAPRHGGYAPVFRPQNARLSLFTVLRDFSFANHERRTHRRCAFSQQFRCWFVQQRLLFLVSLSIWNIAVETHSWCINGAGQLCKLCIQERASDWSATTFVHAKCPKSVAPWTKQTMYVDLVMASVHILLA